MADPLHQFQIQKVVELPTIDVAGVPVDLSITNSVLAMLIGVGCVVLFFALTTARASIIPGRFQVMAEGLFGLIDDLSESIIGHEGRAFFPFVFTLFLFILSCNLVGMTTYFTATSQLAVTAMLAILTIGTVIVVGFIKNGFGFFKLFMPSGVPLLILPILIPIEIISFLMRPITLTLRLFGNMVGGHIVMKVFAGFIVALASAGALGYLGGFVSLTAVVALTALEFLVAYLQAFVFAVLACVYLNDVVNLHHH
ncbi:MULTISPECIES: F0F1 ATP synthase subunit A [Asticcacaulis]|uniref:ATP synthase subunit a n=1 Tax=Asticcacaulis excentricus (strain ATCC 15261 / DSM 4724 / KCTC 12464 / NCIMB 9791 / VKM B-1370 / CB 48) TaxID=573065 RepID=E8RMH2_ASTEC|nr:MULTISPECIES: F0F1 ATP synthase subunit A [Asticcacaulis]ADU12792.1 ATP synthase F0, A subunit [Asticcacaulis excentricus CB 48]MCA1936589.1 F0F1 ATP synthase subunit A [Asticcacaulis sp.]